MTEGAGVTEQHGAKPGTATDPESAVAADSVLTEPPAKPKKNKKKKKKGKKAPPPHTLITSTHAVVIVLLDQSVTSINSTTPVINRNRAVVTLVRTKGKWLISGLDLK